MKMQKKSLITAAYIIIVIVVFGIGYLVGRADSQPPLSYEAELNGSEQEQMILDVEGFEVEYKITDREITVEDFDNIEIGSSIQEISQKVGEPDTWIGSGMLRPVYLLTDNKAVVLHFTYPAACDDLKQIALIDENGESRIIKE